MKPGNTLFSGFSGLTNKAKQAALPCVAAVVNEVGQKDITVAHVVHKAHAKSY